MGFRAETYNGVVTTDGTRGGGKRVGGTEDGCYKQLVSSKPKSLSSMKENLLRPVLTTSRPSQTMAAMGPLSMSSVILA